MIGNGQTYKDRFGHEWSVSEQRKRGKLTGLSFSCGDFLLIAEVDEEADQGVLTSARLKELFCDAERVLECEDEKWYVGFRTRMGRGGRVQGGMHTRFRSESGEVRYAKGMLHFRHMAENILRDQLAVAQRASG